MSPSPALRRSILIRRLLLGASLTVLAAVMAIFFGYRHFTKSPETVLEALPEKTSIAMGRVEHTATRDGRTEWRLEAASASLLEGKKWLTLSDLAVVFFRETGGEIQLKADRGRLDTATKDMQTLGRVVVSDETYRLETEALDYKHRPRRISCTAPVEIVSDQGTVTADAMVYDINTRRAELWGKVDVQINKPLGI
jgi:lipopolysaccharide export system protein LptC